MALEKITVKHGALTPDVHGTARTQQSIGQTTVKREKRTRQTQRSGKNNSETWSADTADAHGTARTQHGIQHRIGQTTEYTAQHAHNSETWSAAHTAKHAHNRALAKQQ